MDWITFVSNGCIFSTIIMFSTGIPECVGIVRKQSVKLIPFLPYLMTAMNCAFWALYGHMTNNFTVILVNGVGLFLQSSYIVVYMNFAVKKKKETLQILIAVLFYLICWSLLTRVIPDAVIAIRLAGLISCIITMMMFSSPLSEINIVIANKSTATISFPLTVASFICATMWTAFGFLALDAFIIVPNMVGVITSLLRFYLFKKYSQKAAALPM